MDCQTKPKDNFPSTVYVCSGHFEDDCFDSSWMLQSTLTYSDRTIQRRLCAGAIPKKLSHKPVKERHFPKQREETHRKKEVCFSHSQKLLPRKLPEFQNQVDKCKNHKYKA